MTFELRVDPMFFLARKSSTVEERSEAIVRKLEVLDQRLASKVMPIIKMYALVVQNSCILFVVRIYDR